MSWKDWPYWLKGGIVSIISALGGFFAVGSLLAAYLEIQPMPVQTPAGKFYLPALALGFLASVGVPAFLWRLFFPSMRWLWLVPLVIGVIGAVAILGIKIF